MTTDNPYLSPEDDPDGKTVVAPHAAQGSGRSSERRDASRTYERPLRRTSAAQQYVSSDDYAPQRGYYDDEEYYSSSRGRGRTPSDGTHSAATRAVLHIVAWICRILAILTSVVVVACAFGVVMAIPFVSGYYQWLESWAPAVLNGRLSFQTILGGAFRGDFALIAVILFIVDWVCLKASSSLR